MSPGEYEQMLHDAEIRLSRVKALYEQFFQGIEKLEPTVPRKELDRVLEILRKNQPRNTALRFRTQMLVARYGTYQTYWQRVSRQIEEGTYRRDVVRVQQKRRREQAQGIKPREEREAASGWEIDVDVDLDDPTLSFDESDVDAILGSLGPKKSADPSIPPAAAPGRRLSPFASSLPPSGARSIPAPAMQPVAPAVKPAVASFAKPIATFGKPGTGTFGKPAMSAPKAAEGPTATADVPAIAPPQPKMPLPITPPAAPPIGSPMPKVAPPIGSPMPRPVAPPIGSPMPKVAPPIGSPMPRPVAPPIASPSAAKAPPPPAPRPAPAAAPPRPAPPAPARDPLDETRMRTIYDSYVDARKRNNERVDTLKYESVKQSVEQMMPKLREKHGDRPIDFEVVVQNGKVGLKPKVGG